MKKVILLALAIIVLITTLYIQTQPKEKLIEQANKKDINSMIDLNKQYYFIQTKEGLAHFKRWYPLVLGSEDTKGMLNFADILLEHKDLFINGELKYLKLLETAKQNGSKEADFKLLEYYEDNMIGDTYFKRKFAQIKDEIQKDQSKENLLKLRDTLKKIHQRKEAKKVTKILEEKGYIDTSTQNRDELNEAYRKSQYVGYDKDRLPNIINKIIASKSLDDILYTSDTIRHREHEFREKLLNTALELTDDKKIKGDIYFDLADNKIKLRKHLYKIRQYYEKDLRKAKDETQKEKAQKKIDELNKERKEISKELLAKYYEEAIKYDHFKALKELYYIYNRNISKYSKEYHRVVKKLKETDKGLKFYLEKNPYAHHIDLFEKLARKGDKGFILRIAKQNLNGKQPELEEVARKNRDYILNSNDYKLHLDMKKILNSYSYKHSEKAKEFLAKLEKKEQNWENIYLLREKISNTRDRELELKYLELAYSYGDIKSALKLASRKVAWGYDWKYQDKKEQARQEIPKGLKIYEELAKQDEKKALVKLAEIYSLKTFMDQEVYDLTKALKYYERLAELGENFYLKRAIKLYKCKTCSFYDEEKLAKKLEDFLEKSFDTHFARELGMLYYKKGKLQDLKKAKKYFELSKSYYYLARLYYDKDGLGIDPKKSYSYLKKCAYLDMHRPKCNHLMGIFYKDGFGTDQDDTKAIQHLRSASYEPYANPPLAALALGELYKKHARIDLATILYIRVAKYYKTEAIDELHKLNQENPTLNDELKKLHSHFLQENRRAFGKYEEKQSALCLAYMYKKGIGVKKDLEKAKEWRDKPSRFAY